MVPWQFEQVVLVRHIETEWNAVGRRQRRLDSPLTRKGSAQADALARSMHGRGAGSRYPCRPDQRGDRGLPPGGVRAPRRSRSTTGGSRRESYSDAYLRAGRVLQRIERDGAARPLLVTYEMLARMLIRHLLGVPPREALEWNLPHGEAIELITDGTALVLPPRRELTRPSLDERSRARAHRDSRRRAPAMGA